MPYAPPPAPVKRGKPWLLAVGLLLALVAGGAYIWKYSQHPPGDQLLEFTALYVACPLGLSVLALFAYLRGGR
jgi:hypothetical protein